ncbi:monooxygenase [Tepidibacter hydrothermalis]|uniref:Monooxygenase n=1 Tax=Tepidibacter hydrothermalis TaxID=3036126 RepID=A0ABY8E7J9_9FIRM|nr:monooxygenase [Tepidibacter hydrothermalis]WFD08886.1 monooxygenase [Tepidibacter hydrothermalis]
MRLLQMDFKTEGPWGDDMSIAFKELAKDISTEDKLIWKIWTENEETGEGGGIYLFETQEALDKYLKKHTERLTGFGITDIIAKVFNVNEPLTLMNRGYLGETR